MSDITTIVRSMGGYQPAGDGSVLEAQIASRGGRNSGTPTPTPTPTPAVLLADNGDRFLTDDGGLFLSEIA